MTATRAFTHTDNRVFTYVGDAPHITRDQRQVTLKTWSTTCSKEGCTAPLLIRTATDTPEQWQNFSPAKFCPQHRAEARRHAIRNISPEARAAQREGFNRWLQSPERASHLQARRARLGVVEKAVMEALDDLELVTDTPTVGEVISAATARLAPPAPGKRDSRRAVILRAITSLQARKFVHLADGGTSVRKRPRP